MKTTLLDIQKAEPRLLDLGQCGELSRCQSINCSSARG